MRRVYQLLAKLMAIAAVLLFGFGLAGPAGAKPVTQQYQDLKIVYTASVANTMAKSIHLVLQDASGKALNKFKVSVTAAGFTVTGDSNSFTLTGNVNDGATVTLRIKSVAAYNGTISLQSASFMNGGNTVGTGAVTGGALAGDPIYSITNTVTPSLDLTVTNLLFYESHSAVDFGTLDPAVPIDSSGVLQPDLTLDGSGTFQDYSLPTGADTPFFISQGTVYEEGDDSPVAWFVDGYTTVPEPSGVAVLVPLLGGLWVIRRVGRGRRGVAAGLSRVIEVNRPVLLRLEQSRLFR